MRILLISDVHLDAPFAWAPAAVARRRRQALQDAFARAIDLARHARVDAICCGGDLFEHERVSPDTSRFLRAQFESAHPIPVYLAPGNHDWLARESLYLTERWSPNVRVFDTPRLAPVTLADGLTLWGAAHAAPAGTRGFLDDFHVDRGGIHVALFHGSEAGAAHFQDDAEEPHAPFRAEQIEASGLHFALLGHFHTPRDAARFVYPGNPEPLTFGESGLRGPAIVTVLPDGRAEIVRHSVALSAIHDIALDVTGLASRQDVRDRVRQEFQGRRGYARLTLAGELSPDVDLSLSDFDDLAPTLDAPPVVRFQALRVAYDLDRIALEPTVRGQFVRDVHDSGLPPDERLRVIVTGLRALDGRPDLEVF